MRVRTSKQVDASPSCPTKVVGGVAPSRPTKTSNITFIAVRKKMLVKLAKLAKLAKFPVYRHLISIEVGQLHPIPTVLFGRAKRVDASPPYSTKVVGGVKSSRPTKISNKTHIAILEKTLAKFLFYRHFFRIEVGQVGQLHPTSADLREGKPKRLEN